MSGETRVAPGFRAAVAGVDGMVIDHPVLLDAEGGTAGIDALVGGPHIGLILIEEWAGSTLPKTFAGAAWRLESEGVFALTPNPVHALTAFSTCLHRAAGPFSLRLPDEALQLVLVAPNLSTGDRRKLADAHAGLGLRVVRHQDEAEPRSLQADLDGTKLTKLLQRVATPHAALLENNEVKAAIRSFETRASAVFVRANAEAAWTVSRKRLENASTTTPTVAIVGTFSAGKTTLVNGITAPFFFPIGDEPTTACATVIRHGAVFSANVRYRTRLELEQVAAHVSAGRTKLPRGVMVDPSVERAGSTAAIPTWNELCALITDNKSSAYIAEVEVALPVEALRMTTLIDLPGVDSHLPWHKEVTFSHLHRADALVCVLRAGQPFTRADKGLLENIAARRSVRRAGQMLFLANGIDNVSSRERPVVIEYLRGQLSANFGILKPEVLPTCGRLAEIPSRLKHTEMIREEREAAEWDIRDSLGALDFSEDGDDAVARKASGIERLERFLADVHASRTVFQTRSAIEDAVFRLMEFGRHLERSALAADQTAARLREIRTSMQQRQLDLIERGDELVAKAKQFAEQEMAAKLNAAALKAGWDARILAHNGDLAATKASLEGHTREALTSAVEAVRTKFDEALASLDESLAAAVAAFDEALVAELMLSTQQGERRRTDMIAATPLDVSVIEEGQWLGRSFFRLAKESWAWAEQVRTTGSWGLGVVDFAVSTSASLASVLLALTGVLANAAQKILEFFVGNADRLMSERKSLAAQMTLDDARRETTALAEGLGAGFFPLLDARKAKLRAVLDERVSEIVKAEGASEEGEGAQQETAEHLREILAEVPPVCEQARQLLCEI